MNIEKLKNYNQKLLAILGTTVLLIAIVGLILLSFFTISEISRGMRFNRQKEGILSKEKIEKLQKENKRQQIISYDFPELVDTANLIYMIPVAHKTLSSPEEIDEETLGLLDIQESVSYDKRYSKSFYGSYNNLLIYDLLNNKLTRLFNERINFGKIDTEYLDDDILILFLSANKDTYKDGVINLNDLKRLNLYSLKEQKLKQIELKSADLVSYKFVNNSKDIIIQFGVDQNEDGQYDSLREPTILKKYNYKSDELTEIVSKEINTQLQKKLEGSEK